jgi:DNA repair exonuclease SbcCD ATPase subunit
VRELEEEAVKRSSEKSQLSSKLTQIKKNYDALKLQEEQRAREA